MHEKTLYLSSLRRGKWIAKKWARAFYMPTMRSMPSVIPLSRFPGWNLSVNEENPGLRINFTYTDPQKSWSVYVPPFGSVWIATPLQKKE